MTQKTPPNDNNQNQPAHPTVHTILYFSSPTCRPCKHISDQLPYYQHLIPSPEMLQGISIDDEGSYDICRQYQVRTVPTVITLDIWDRIIERHDGIQAATFIDILRNL